MELALELKPVSLIGFGDGAEAAAFSAMNPATGSPLEPKFFAASAEDLERAAALAQNAFPIYSKLSGKTKGAFLRQIAAAIEASAPAIVKRANLETALPEAHLWSAATLRRSGGRRFLGRRAHRQCRPQPKAAAQAFHPLHA
jgi:NADP-dependent aldehyde dehydrogenase